MQREAVTVAEVAMATVGFRKGYRVLLHISCWLICERALGHRPDVDEYAKWWEMSRAKAYRDQQTFRECFGARGLMNPSDLAVAVGLDVAKMSERKNDKQKLTVELGALELA
jgi:hypothetical protein